MSVPTTRGYVDVELAVQDLAAPLVGGLEHVGTDTPADLAGALPFHRIYRLPGGGDDGLSDDATIVVDTFARSRALVHAAAEDLRQLLTRPGASWHRTPHGVIDSVDTIAAPAVTAEQPSGFRRYTATYRVGVRRTAA